MGHCSVRALEDGVQDQHARPQTVQADVSIRVDSAEPKHIIR